MWHDMVLRAGRAPFIAAWRAADSTALTLILVPISQVAAVSDVAPDYTGSCGRCYELRCANMNFSVSLHAAQAQTP